MPPPSPSPSDSSEKPLSLYGWKQSFAHQSIKYRESVAETRLFHHLAKREPRTGWKIEKAICMALGNLTHLCSVQQLILFFSITYYLRDADEDYKSIPLYAQDPRFDAFDIEILEHLGFEILQAPQAERKTRRGVFTFVPEYTMEYNLLARRAGLQPSLHLGKKLSRTLGNCKCHVKAEIKARKARGHIPLPIDEEVIAQAKQQKKYMKSVAKDFKVFDACSKATGLEGLDHGKFQVFVEESWPEGAEREPEPEDVPDVELFALTARDTCRCCVMPSASLMKMEGEQGEGNISYTYLFPPRPLE